MKKYIYILVGVLIVAGIAFALSQSNLLKGSFHGVETADVEIDTGFIPTMLSDLSVTEIGDLSDEELADIAEDSESAASRAKDRAESALNSASVASADGDSEMLANEQARTQNWAVTADSYAANAEGTEEILDSRVDTYYAIYSGLQDAIRDQDTHSVQESYDEHYLQWKTSFMEFLAYLSQLVVGGSELADKHGDYYDCLVEEYDESGDEEFVTNLEMRGCDFTVYGVVVILPLEEEWKRYQSEIQAMSLVVEGLKEQLEALQSIDTDLEEEKDAAYAIYYEAASYRNAASDAATEARSHADDAQDYADTAAGYVVFGGNGMDMSGGLRE